MPEVEGFGPAAVAGVDVVDHPADLGDGVVVPVGASGGHFVAWEGLGDAVGAGVGIGGVDAAAGFAVDEVDGGGEIGFGDASFTGPGGTLFLGGRDGGLGADEDDLGDGLEGDGFGNEGAGDFDAVFELDLVNGGLAAILTWLLEAGFALFQGIVGAGFGSVGDGGFDSDGAAAVADEAIDSGDAGFEEASVGFLGDFVAVINGEAGIAGDLLGVVAGGHDVLADLAVDDDGGMGAVDVDIKILAGEGGVESWLDAVGRVEGDLRAFEDFGDGGGGGFDGEGGVEVVDGDEVFGGFGGFGGFVGVSGGFGGGGKDGLNDGQGLEGQKGSHEQNYQGVKKISQFVMKLHYGKYYSRWGWQCKWVEGAPSSAKMLRIFWRPTLRFRTCA